MRKTPAERFWMRVGIREPEECWLWESRCDKRGYGIAYYDGRPRRAHRVAWELVHAAIPDGLHVLHRCDNPPCVNPDHLWLGTNADNMRDRDQKGRGRNRYSGKTHCQRGHEFDEKNTYIRVDGWRMCRACKNAGQRAIRRAASRMKANK